MYIVSLAKLQLIIDIEIINWLYLIICFVIQSVIIAKLTNLFTNGIGQSKNFFVYVLILTKNRYVYLWFINNYNFKIHSIYYSISIPLTSTISYFLTIENIKCWSYNISRPENSERICLP